MNRYTAMIEARRAQEAEKQALIDAGLIKPDPISTENLFDQLDRELAIATYIVKEHGSIAQLGADLAVEFAGQKGRTAAEMIAYFRECAQQHNGDEPTTT